MFRRSRAGALGPLGVRGAPVEQHEVARLGDDGDGEDDEHIPCVLVLGLRDFVVCVEAFKHLHWEVTG